jgi:polysaccharide export outer membrane protein
MFRSHSDRGNKISNPLHEMRIGERPRDTNAEYACGRLGLTLLVIICCSLSGCHKANHYYAGDTFFGRKLPQSMRLAERPKVLTVDMTRLAGGAGDSDTINTGDVLEVKIAAGLSEKDQITMGARVSDDGTIVLPEIGSVSVVGIEPSGAESLIRTAAISKQLFYNPAITVRITDRRMNTVKVMGAVKLPGVYKLPPNSSDIVSALAAAQGLADDAGQNIEVRNPIVPDRGERPAFAGDPTLPYSNVSHTVGNSASSSGGMNSYSIDLISAAKAGDGQYLVADGGVIMVEKRDPEVIYVQGLVKKPDRYEFPVGEDLHLLDAISLAGGMSNQLANKIYIVRKTVQGKDPVVIEVSYRAATHSADSNELLGPGDVVKVAHTPATVFMEALNIIRFGVNSSTSFF